MKSSEIIAKANGAMPPDDFFGDVVELPTSGERAAPPPWAERVESCEAEWFTKAPPKRAWLLRDSRTQAGVLPTGKVGMVIGEGGVSKTMVAIALAIAVATGSPWLGTFDVATPGRVLALLGEEDAEEVRRRCYHVARSTGAPIPDLDSIVALPLAGVPCAMIEADDRGNPIDAAFLLWLRAYLAEQEPFALVIVDPLSRFAGLDAEIDNAAATRFVQALESIASETGACVIVVHHTNKAARANGAAVTGASARGSSAFYDGVRWAAALTAERVEIDDADVADRLGELVTLTIVKSNYSRKAEPVLLRRDGENGGALLPLDGFDLAQLGEARDKAEPSTRRRTQREEAERARTAAVAAAVREVLAATPGLSGRALLAAIVARRGQCSRPALEAAIALMGDEVRTAPGPDRSTLHYLEGQS